MRIICTGCNATIDLYEGALDECPLCDTTHNFEKPCLELRDTYRDRTATDHANKTELPSTKEQIV